MTPTLDTTIGDIVARDYRTAAIFERYGIDFCCRGGRTLRQSCGDAGLDTSEVLRDLEGLPARPDGLPDYHQWDPRALIDHIVSTHHAYVREALPRLTAHSRKIATVHGARHRELVRVAELVDAVAAEMFSHMMKEEHILFPYIAQLADAAASGAGTPPGPFGTVANPIQMMEAEHESAGHAMLEIRTLTNAYTPPDDACGTYKVCLQELDAFERDLHTHVHLENSVLFPKALAMEGRG